MQKRIYTTDFGGKELRAEFNDLTTHTNGSVMLRYGETVVLVTAVMGKSDNAGLPYFPLSVEFEERFYAAGQILGSRFVRREGKPSDEAVLKARIVDRTIRPLFPNHLRIDVQIVVTVLAIGEDDPAVLGVIGASLALSTSDIPWHGPVGAVRLIKQKSDGRIIANPTYLEKATDDVELEVFACGKDNRINMIETAAYESSEETVIELLKAATEINASLEVWQKTIVAEIGKKKRQIEAPAIPQSLSTFYTENFQSKLKETLFSARAGKDHIYELREQFLNELSLSDDTTDKKLAGAYFEEQVDVLLHRGAVEEGVRADGRDLDSVRELYAEAGGISPVLHGSGIFYRGGTRIFTALTLGGPESALLVDNIEEQSVKKPFMHHYNFPPFSVGETGRVGGFNRRMIGHGALAQKALIPVLPKAEEFPYTIRLVSETMSSNGSSSMGSVCASSLALMDGGVPITRAVAGIASGVMMLEGKYALLTDIQGPEDEYGDMDFKVAGTTVGVTAIQMDVKVDGIPVEILAEALDKARTARLTILKTLTSAIASPRENISVRAPKIIMLQILPEQIGLVIGQGGKTINGIKSDTLADEITIEEDGRIFITGKNGAAELAAERIRTLTKRFVVGDRVVATITKLAAFGAFAKIDTYNEGLIHISEIAPFRLETVEGALTVGEEVQVLVSKVEDGKIGLSIKQVDPDFAEKKGIKKP
jgi:polyribonucleotide nucleotidyltransferase